MTPREKIIRISVGNLLLNPDYSEETIKGICEAAVKNKIFQCIDSKAAFYGVVSNMYLTGYMDGMCKIIADLVDGRLVITQADFDGVGQSVQIDIRP